MLKLAFWVERECLWDLFITAFPGMGQKPAYIRISKKRNWLSYVIRTTRSLSASGTGQSGESKCYQDNVSLHLFTVFLLVDFSLSRSSQHLSSPHFAKDVRSSSRLKANQPSNSSKKNGPHCSIVLKKKILRIHCLDQLRSHVHPWTSHCGQGNGIPWLARPKPHAPPPGN